VKLFGIRVGRLSVFPFSVVQNFVGFRVGQTPCSVVFAVFESTLVQCNGGDQLVVATLSVVQAVLPMTDITASVAKDEFSGSTTTTIFVVVVVVAAAVGDGGGGGSSSSAVVVAVAVAAAAAVRRISLSLVVRTFIPFVVGIKGFHGSVGQTQTKGSLVDNAAIGTTFRFVFSLPVKLARDEIALVGISTTTASCSSCSSHHG